ncbi:TonB-dependent receptor [Ancylomarina euxinus]|uniref:TonB-dependent receptor n=1 Tax=Ancylomarina euxinus TaxID=2283627 RepID=A0A425Y5Q6_9BACT|nr:TonB-dependent receptor [Ancylomarina euxinus]MCZ4694234.1 TonB-dependent receptor [Ancylomarina euxinus]MUP14435.1 TonB-dependent receptor plug domain-containing protein [Ancylomarina euxinus]RRG23740.1 TonB-dependent receptor [Ancylomarina euxinus]
MKLLRFLFIIQLLLPTTYIWAQSGVIKGRVYNQINNEAIPFANIAIANTTLGTTADINGNYRLEKLKPGNYNLVCSSLGYKTQFLYEIRLSPSKPSLINIALQKEIKELNEIVVSAPAFNKTEESPLSMRTINTTEIYRSPGGNRDISKVIQVLPGVASTLSFRNDIIVRGGSPNENRFYLDGIEVANINHFATQGASGGPVGMINVNFIRELDFYAGAFPASKGNALSSILDFKQRKGNDEKLAGSLMLGSSDLGLSLEGPIGKNSTFIFSVRRSYLQILFKALKLPFLPTYNDAQFKHNIKLDSKNELTFIGLGALDDFKLNTSANNGLKDADQIERNTYILGNLPVNNQWNYTLGAKWLHYSRNSYQSFIVSRNHLNNEAIKYRNNIEEDDLLLLNYKSQEIENKIKIESTKRKNGWKWNIGSSVDFVEYTNSTFNKKEQNGQVVTIDFDSELNFRKFGLFTQISRKVLDDRLSISFGLRTDFSDYSKELFNPLDQLSPRLSASYALSPKFNINFNTGRYFQLPAYTVMGYRDNNNNLVNKNNKITYIESNHLVSGIDYNPTQYSKISVEGFYKTYKNYPFLLADSVSLANLGGDFGVIGNEAAKSISKGRSYGLEILLQQKLSSSIYGIVSYTWVRSEFKDKNGIYIPSSWDNKHILNLTAGKKFNNNWEFGLKFRLLGPAPYTPYNVELSAQKVIWDVAQSGQLDWNQLNKKRNPTAHTMDIRLDKKWYFNKWSINAYLDIQNIYNFKAKTQPYLNVEKDAAGVPIEDPNNPLAYKIKEIENDSGTILPSIGLMIEF